MADSTEVAKRTDMSTSEIIRAGAELEADDWPEAKLAAVRSMLPKEARGRPEHMIAYLARAQRTGLDPFLNELWAWEDKGEIVFMTGRDGWLRLAKDDPNVEGLEFGEIHKNDKWSLSQEGGKIMVSHQIGMPRGNLIGAYCVVHMKGEAPDAQVVKEMSDFSHLMGKKNWRENPGIMSVTRCISEAVKLKVPAGSGLYSPEEWEMRREAGDLDRQTAASAAAEGADELAARLDQAKEETERPPVETTATEEPEGEAEAEEPAGEAASPTPESESEPDEPSTAEDSPEEDGGPDEDVETGPCPVCTEPIPVDGRSRGGHLAGHTRAGWKLPDDYRVVEEDDGFRFVTPDGEIKGVGPQDRALESWQKAVNVANNHADRAGEDDEEGKEGAEPEGSTEPSTEPPESQDASEKDEGEEGDPESWGDAYKSLAMAVQGEMEEAYDVAEKLYPKALVDGRIKLQELTAEEILEVKAEIEESS